MVLGLSKSAESTNTGSHPFGGPILPQAIDLEDAAISRSRELPEPPSGAEEEEDYVRKLNNVIMDGAARMASIDSGENGFAPEDSKKLLITDPILTAEDRFFLTATPPEEYRRTGVLRPLRSMGEVHEYYLVDRGEEESSFHDEFCNRRDVYLLRIRIEDEGERHSARISAYECSRGQGDLLERYITARLKCTAHDVTAPLHQPKVLPEINETAVAVADGIIKQDWGSYCWGERFRKIGTTLAWIGGFIAWGAYFSQFTNSEMRANLTLDLGCALSLNIIGFGGLNLLINNLKDIKTSGKLTGIAEGLEGEKDETKQIELLSALRPADFEFLAQRAEKGSIQLTVGFRSTVHTETTLQDDEGVRILESIGTAALKNRDTLMAMGVFVPPADWFAVRLGVHVNARENATREEELSEAIADTVETFRRIGWESGASK